MISRRWDGRSSCDASRSASWRVSRKAATPTRMNSSAVTAVTIPTWITATSRLNFSGSAGRTHLRPASRHMGSTSRFGTGSSRFVRQARGADQRYPHPLRQVLGGGPREVTVRPTRTQVLGSSPGIAIPAAAALSIGCSRYAAMRSGPAPISPGLSSAMRSAISP